MAFTTPSAPPKKVSFPNILCYPNSFMMKLPKKKNRTEAAAGGVRWKKACNFIKKETPTQLFSCEFCYILKNTFLTEYLRMNSSDHRWCDIKKAENADARVSFNKVAGLQDWKFVKRLLHSCFPVSNTKSFRTPILMNNCEQRALEELGRRYFGSTYKAR